MAGRGKVLSLARFADIKASFDDGVRGRDEVLRAAGLTEEEWGSVERQWSLWLSEGARADLPEVVRMLMDAEEEEPDELPPRSAREPPAPPSSLVRHAIPPPGGNRGG